MSQVHREKVILGKANNWSKSSKVKACLAYSGCLERDECGRVLGDNIRKLSED